MARSKTSSIVVPIITVLLVVLALLAVLQVPAIRQSANENYLWLRNNLLETRAISNWQLYLLFLSVLYVAVSICVLMVKPRPPKVNSYKKDEFLGVLWQWSYNRKMPTDPWCYCPECNNELVYTYTGSRSDQETELFCESCDITRLRHDGDKNYLINRVIRLIERKIRTEEWKDTMPKNWD